MQGAVERILAGEFHNGLSSLEFSVSKIELSLQEGESREGSFFVCGPEHEMTEGRVFSDSFRMRCVTEYFAGSREEICYCFDAGGMKEGDSLKGVIGLISNQGEYSVPYEVTVSAPDIVSSLGEIRNLFHFTNLAKSNWEEAVALFYSGQLDRIFKGADRQHYAAYRGLSGGERRSQNVEEFLLETGKKQKLQLLAGEPEITILNPRENVEYQAVIQRNGWGFSEFSVETDGAFLVTEKEMLRDEDFLGNCCRLPFYLSPKALHGGRNFGSIRIYNAYTSVTFTVTVHCQGNKKLPGIRLQKKKLVLELMRHYEAFRSKRLGAGAWMEQTEQILDRLSGLDDRDLSIRLFRIQLLITMDRQKEAQWMLEQLSSVIEERFQPELYAYYLYLTTLLNREEDYINETAARVERIYVQNTESWRIAWLLLYLQEDYEKTASGKWMILEQQLKQGCQSPVFYLEAWNLIAANPSLLTRLEDFEGQVLWYAAKKGLLTKAVASQAVYLGGRQKAYSDRVFYLLKKCYAISQDDETLSAICTLLIKGNKTEPEHFVWYALSVERELRITRLYEYYMMSCELREGIQLPKIVLMYFAFDSNLDSFRNAFLYAYVHQNREEYPELYESYREQIERFTVFQALKGRNNKWLAYLYRNVLNQAMITEETAKGLSVSLFIHRLLIRREDIRRVIVIYEKQKEETVFQVMGREVYLPVYGNNCRILLEDGRGNRYCLSEEYVLERLSIPDKLAAVAAPYVTEEPCFDLWMCEKGDCLAEVSPSNLEQMKRLSGADILLPSLEKEIRMRLLRFYFEHDRFAELDDFLRELLPEQVERECVPEVIRFLTARGMYEKAYEWLARTGSRDVEPKVIMRLCSRLLLPEPYDREPLMLFLCRQAFLAGKYDEQILRYLVRFYEGTLSEMEAVQKAAKAFSMDTYELDERLLIRMLYTGTDAPGKTEIFRSYIAGGAREEVELAYLAQCSFDYFVKGKEPDEFTLQALQRAAGRLEELPRVCLLSYTRYFAFHKDRIDEKTSRLLIHFLRELLDEKLYFPYFKEYAENISFMRQFGDKTMVQYQTKEGSKAVIHYLLEGSGEKGQEEPERYQAEEMKDMFCGICVKQFVLFTGEKLRYYITEAKEDQEQLKESGTLSVREEDRKKWESRYRMLNDLIAERYRGDDAAMEELLHEYFEQAYLVKKLFHIL